jgi:hypothetical protein
MLEVAEVEYLVALLQQQLPVLPVKVVVGPAEQ